MSEAKKNKKTLKRLLSNKKLNVGKQVEVFASF